MKLKELLKGKQPLSKLGTNKFRLTLDKEAVKTPHVMIDRVLLMLENRPSVMNGLRQHVRFLLNNISFTSEDEKSQTFAREWLENRPQMKQELFKFTQLLIACGTSYLEPQMAQYVGGKKRLNTYHAFPDPSIVYKNLSTTSDEDYWIVEVPMEVRSYEGHTPRQYPVYYMRGSYVFRRLT